MTLEGTHNLWGGLHRPDLSPAQADFTVLGIPFDGLASARKGAALAPGRIRYWSRHVTPFSEDRTRLDGLTVCDAGDIPISRIIPDFEQVAQNVASLPQGIPILLVG